MVRQGRHRSFTKKRAVFRKMYNLEVNGSSADQILYTASRTVTLIRTRMEVKINSETVSGGTQIMDWELWRKYDGQNLPTIDIVTDVIYSSEDDLIMKEKEAVMRETTGANGGYRYCIDSKGQREFKPGTQLVLVLNGGAFMILSGIMTTWWKEA